jgi:hypothetical protein
MIKRLRDNENLRRLNYFKTKATYIKHSRSIHVDFKTATLAEREEIRKRVKEERATAKRKSIFIFILSVLLTMALLFFLMKLVESQWHST